MSNEFYVKMTGLKTSRNDFTEICQKINSENENIEKLICELRENDSYKEIRNALMRNKNRNTDSVKVLGKMEQTLGTIVDVYISAEEHKTIKIAPVKGTVSDEIGKEDKKGDVKDYITDALDQAIKGDFSEENNALGITLSVFLGFVPGVAQLADLRDVSANIYKLFDDGATSEEWVDFLFSCAGFIPIIGDVAKHADDAGPVLKHIDEVYSAVGNKVDDFNDMFDKKVVSRIKEEIDKNPDLSKITEKVEKVMEKDLRDWNLDTTVGGLLKELGKEASGIEDNIKSWISDGIDKLFDNDTKSSETGKAVFWNKGFQSAVAA